MYKIFLFSDDPTGEPRSTACDYYKAIDEASRLAIIDGREYHVYNPDGKLLTRVHMEE